MAFDVFIKIDGIPGESSDDKHKEWIEVLGFSHQIEQPASSTASSVGGATAERVNHGSFNFTHSFDKATPKLLEACCTGKHIKEVTVEFCRAGGDKVKYMEIKLEQVLIPVFPTMALVLPTRGSRSRRYRSRTARSNGPTPSRSVKTVPLEGMLARVGISLRTRPSLDDDSPSGSLQGM